MTLADVLAVISGLALAGAGFACLAVILSLLKPRALERAGARAIERPVVSASLGLLIFFASAVLWGTLLKVPFPPARLLAIVGILAVFCLAALGGAGLASRLGRTYSGTSGAAALDDVLRGVFLLEGAALLPIVGWFVVLPVSFLVCLGAGFQASVSRRAPQVAAAAAAPQA